MPLKVGVSDVLSRVSLETSPDPLCHLSITVSYFHLLKVMIFHILMFIREELIDKKTENAVSRMQSVIELGRVIRDRKTVPIKVCLDFC